MAFITKFSLDRNRLTVVFIAAVIIIGLNQFFSFPRQEDPPIVIREVVVTAFFPGMKPAEMEELVTSNIEAELRTLPELADIWSDSKHGVAIIHAETIDEVDDLDLVWQRVRNRMSDLRPHLPQGTIGPFVNDEFGLTAVATIALWSEGFSLAEMREVAIDLRDRLYELPGIRQVELHGVHPERIFLKFSSSSLAQFGISAEQITNTLVTQNIVLPAGRVSSSDLDVVVVPSGNFRSLEDIEDVEFNIPDTQQTIRLKDVMSVERGHADPPRELAYFKGQRSIVLSVSITPGVNSVEFGDLLTTKLNQLESQLPVGYVLEFATFQPDLVENAVNGGLNNVYQTIGIVLVVVMLFLGVRTGLIVGSFVPLTMLLGLILMRFFGIELERVSIASSIIALGMLVDNGIVIAEDIRNRLERGQDRKLACIETGQTLALPLLTSSLTTILAFLPMLLMDGQTGDYAFSLPMVVILLLLSSWFLSMYVTPSMCYWFMKTDVKPATNDSLETDQDDTAEDEPEEAGRFFAVYRRLLEVMLRKRLIVSAAAIAAIFCGFFVASLLVREFFGPSTDRNQFLVYIDLPAGNRIESTDETVKKLTRWLLDKSVNPEVSESVAYVGSGGPRFFLVLSPVQPNPHLAFLVVSTEKAEQVPVVMERLRNHFIKEVPEAEGRVKQMWLGAAEPGLVELRLVGQNPEYLFEKGTQLVDGLRSIRGIIDVHNDWENKVLYAQIVVDQVRARRAQVTSQEIALWLESYMDGREITQFREGDLAIPILARSVEKNRTGLGDLWNARITSRLTGNSIPITQIADIEIVSDFYRISRRNQERCLTVAFKHEELRAPELLKTAMPLINNLDLQPGYRWEIGGEIESSQETNEKLMNWLPICVFGIVVLLIWQFNSFRRPLIIFITIPLAFTGGFIGLLLTGAPFDFFAMLGLLSLAGVIINNGIVLIDKIDSDRAKGGEPYDAVINAAVSRFRPILMTTVTTVLGLMPLILSVDPLFFSMAIVLASGLIFGTVLTLGIVPALYSVLFGVSDSR